MTAVQKLKTALAGVLPDRDRERYDPFDDVDRVVGRADVDATETLEYPLPDGSDPGTDGLRILIDYATDDVLELDGSLYELVDDVVTIAVPAAEDRAFDIWVRTERRD